MEGNGAEIQDIETDATALPSAPDAPSPDAASAARERSSIEFPYGDLDDAEEVALAIHNTYGLQCTIDQLAASLKQMSTSGAFRNKLSTARTFGVVESERGAVTLTDLGRKIVDASQRSSARGEAFLRVPLYDSIHRKFLGHLLPPPAALEREMAGFGVAKKQTPRARQAFERSAMQAGFFAHGTDRLVAPPMGGAPETRPIAVAEPPTRGGGGDDGLGNLHPFVQGLLKTLPEPGDDWPTADRIKWLRTAANIFDLIYEGSEGEISVSQPRRDSRDYGDDRR